MRLIQGNGLLFPLFLFFQVEDAAEADEVFRDLMGDDVQKRREFIEATATAVANLDI